MIRVIKIGGSLFELPDLAPRIDRLLSKLPPAKNVLLAGGGALTRTIRNAQEIHQLSDEDAHWLCIRAMSVTALGLKMLFRQPDLRVTTSVGTIRDATQNALWIFDAERLLRSERACETVTKLPKNWDTSSDSIAAALAVELHAQELVILKSVGWPNDLEPRQIQPQTDGATQELVDRYFPVASLRVPKIGWCDLRRREYGCTWIKATQ